MKLLTGALVAMLAGMAARDAQVPTRVFPLQGTWTLVAADKVLPDGETTRDYGENPKGRLVVDAKGQYSLQIFKSERLHFASDSKADGSVDELRSAVMGSSTHYGTMTIDERAGMLVFSIEGSSFFNWEGTTQRRQYKLDGAELRYRCRPGQMGASRFPCGAGLIKPCLVFARKRSRPSIHASTAEAFMPHFVVDCSQGILLGLRISKRSAGICSKSAHSATCDFRPWWQRR